MYIFTLHYIRVFTTNDIHQAVITNLKSQYLKSTQGLPPLPPSLLNMCIEGQLKTLFFIFFNLMIFAVGLAPVYFGSREKENLAKQSWAIKAALQKSHSTFHLHFIGQSKSHG